MVLVSIQVGRRASPWMATRQMARAQVHCQMARAQMYCQTLSAARALAGRGGWLPWGLGARTRLCLQTHTRSRRALRSRGVPR